MRVVATEDFKAYMNYQSLSIPKGHVMKGRTAAYLLSTGAPVERIDEETAPASPDPDPEPPTELDPEGTADHVLAWAGDDPERAAAALEAEQAKDSPRKTLVKKLEKLSTDE